MWTMVRLTFREMLNKRILHLGLTLTLLYLAFFGVGLYFMSKDMLQAPELSRQAAAAVLLTAGLFVSGLLVSGITIFSAVGAISSEIDNGIMQAVAAKPLDRSDIFLGKYIGLGLALIAYSLMIFLATTLLVRFFFNFKTGSFIEGMIIFCLQPLVLLAIAMWGSSFMSTLGNGITTFILYSLSVVGGLVEQIGAEMAAFSQVAGEQVVSSTMNIIGIITSLIIPTDSMYRLVNFKLIYESTVPVQVLSFNPFSTMTPPSVWMLVYTGAYILLFTWWGARIFSQRDL